VDPKRIVAAGYDRIGEAYARWTATGRTTARDRYTELILDTLPPGASLLELGCGAGVPTTKRLAERFAVTGVDISARQIERARANVPHATFLNADMTAVDFPSASFDAVVAFYSIIHVPREEHGPLLRAIVSWLGPGGWLVAAMGARGDSGTIEDDWLGTPMFFSHHDTATNRRLVEEAGLQIVRAVEETEDEDGQPVTFLWVVARKPGG